MELAARPARLTCSGCCTRMRLRHHTEDVLAGQSLAEITALDPACRGRAGGAYPRGGLPDRSPSARMQLVSRRTSARLDVTPSELSQRGQRRELRRKADPPQPRQQDAETRGADARVRTCRPWRRAAHEDSGVTPPQRGEASLVTQTAADREYRRGGNLQMQPLDHGSPFGNSPASIVAAPLALDGRPPRPRYAGPQGIDDRHRKARHQDQPNTGRMQPVEQPLRAVLELRGTVSGRRTYEQAIDVEQEREGRARGQVAPVVPARHGGPALQGPCHRRLRS